MDRGEFSHMADRGETPVFHAISIGGRSSISEPCGPEVDSRAQGGSPFSEEIRALAARYIWWKSPEEALLHPVRVVAQVMDLGGFHDYALLEDGFGQEVMREALASAEAGWFRDRSWTYWHYRLGLIPWGDEVPRQPTRDFHG